MNREILFRGKRLGNNEWLYGSHFTDSGEDYIIPQNLLGINDYEEYQVDQNTVGQFTGQYDKNDKKIYEGDVVRWEYPDYDNYTGWRGTVKNVCKVTFEYGSFRINAYPYNLGSCEDFFEDKETYGLEVIGNIYDNPELLSTK